MLKNFVDKKYLIFGAKKLFLKIFIVKNFSKFHCKKLFKISL